VWRWGGETESVRVYVEVRSHEVGVRVRSQEVEEEES
jgi:hypothetical protein